MEKITNILSWGNDLLNKYLLAFTVTFLLAFGMYAQGVPSMGFPYQGVARDGSGRPLAGMKATIQVSLSTSADQMDNQYEELHEVQTDAQGYFTLIVGEGNPRKGEFGSLPWYRGQLWMHVALQANDGRGNMNVLSSVSLPAVPYAMHALSTSCIEADTAADVEKQQSIFWLSGGYSLTKPGTHFLGTRDKQDLIFKTNNKTRMTVTKEGQVNVQAGDVVTGEPYSFDAFSVLIKGANQGIHVKVNGSRTGKNTYVRFSDDFSKWGQIVGETFAEFKLKEGKDGYPFVTKYFNLKVNELNLTIVATTALISAAVSTGVGAAEAVAIGLDAAALASELAFSIAENVKFNNDAATFAGVAFESGAADYAEYVERAPGERHLYPGEVVGIKNGRLSLNTDNADYIFAISSLPIELGNMPKDADSERYEKVAFMGQVKVRVAGTTFAGDFILASGRNDGFAIAVRPQDMQADDYARILGVAWSSSDTAIRVPFQLINVAVGINSNVLSAELVQLERQVDAITAFLEGKADDFKVENLDRSSEVSPITSLATEKKMPLDLSTMTVEQHAAVLDNNKVIVEQIFQKAKSMVIEKDSRLKDHAQLMALMDNPIPALKAMYEDPDAFFERFRQAGNLENR